MKLFEPAYFTLLTISLVNWIVSAVDLGSKLAAFAIAVMTIFYLYEKYKGLKIDNKIKKKQLND